MVSLAVRVSEGAWKKEVMVLTEGDRGKQVPHRCGYLLWVRVLGQMEWSGQVVVEYRAGDGGWKSLPVYSCPRCGKRLNMWWHVPRKGGERMGQTNVLVSVLAQKVR